MINLLIIVLRAVVAVANALIAVLDLDFCFVVCLAGCSAPVCDKVSLWG